MQINERVLAIRYMGSDVWYEAIFLGSYTSVTSPGPGTPGQRLIHYRVRWVDDDTVDVLLGQPGQEQPIKPL